MMIYSGVSWRNRLMSRNSFIFIHSCRPILWTTVNFDLLRVFKTNIYLHFYSHHFRFNLTFQIWASNLHKAFCYISKWLSLMSHFHPPIFPAKCQLWESSLILFLPGISLLQKSRRTIWTCHIKLTPTFLIPNSIRADSPIILHHVIKHWTAIFIK